MAKKEKTDKKKKKDKKDKTSKKDKSLKKDKKEKVKSKKDKKEKKGKKDKTSSKKSKKKVEEVETEGTNYSITDICENAEVDPTEIKAFFDAFRRKLQKMSVGSQIRIQSLANFSKVKTKPRKSRNPRTGESVDVPAKKKIKIKPSASLKNL